MNIIVRKMRHTDREFWFTLDRHIPEALFDIKLRDGMGYVAEAEGEPVGLLRYGLFWDNTPMCNLLYVKNAFQRQGIGRKLMEKWERDMVDYGYRLLLVSTQSDEDAQHFYRRLAYSDCGALILPFEGFEQPAEIFLGKRLYTSEP